MTKPEALCRAALLAHGMPAHEVGKLAVGRIMDWYVHLVVMNKVSWLDARRWIDKNVDENGEVRVQ